MSRRFSRSMYQEIGSSVQLQEVADRLLSARISLSIVMLQGVHFISSVTGGWQVEGSVSVTLG